MRPTALILAVAGMALAVPAPPASAAAGTPPAPAVPAAVPTAAASAATPAPRGGGLVSALGDTVAGTVQGVTDTVDGVLAGPTPAPSAAPAAPAATAAPAPTAAPSRAATAAPAPAATGQGRAQGSTRAAARPRAARPTASARAAARPRAAAARRVRPAAARAAATPRPAATARPAARTPRQAAPARRAARPRPITLRTVVTALPPAAKVLIAALSVALAVALVLVLRSRRRLAAALKRAHSDALTGLPNRAAADEALARLRGQARRTGSPLAAVMIDVDRFKAVNDEFGHARGDAVLRDVAAALGGAVRAGDVLARYGGEELLLLLPETDTAGAAALAEKLRGVMHEARAGDLGRPVTASFGVAAATDGPALERLVADADEALYAAKANGRDRVEIAAALRLVPAAA